MWAIREVADRLDGKPQIATQIDIEPRERRHQEMTDEELMEIINQGTRDALEPEA